MLRVILVDSDSEMAMRHNDRSFTQLMVQERQHLLQYACYRLGSKEEAEDAVQDVWLKLQQSPSGMDNPMGYLYRTLANLCTSRLRKASAKTMVPLDKAALLHADEPEDFTAEYRRMNALLHNLPDEQQEVIRLRFHGDKSFKEIAAILQVPLPTVKSRFLYGMAKLRRQMKNIKMKEL